MTGAEPNRDGAGRVHGGMGTQDLWTRRRFLGAAGAGIAAAACASAGAGRRSFAPLAYDEAGRLLIEADANGAGPRRWILDTGASRSAIDASFARELGLALGDGGDVEGSAGVVKARSAKAAVRVPGLGTVPIDFTVYDLGDDGSRRVGILGAECLRRAPFRIRYGARDIEWGAARPERTAAMTLDNGIPRIEAAVNGRALPLRIDTGAAFPPGEDAYLNVTEDQAAALGLAGKPDQTFTATGTGGATLSLRVYRLDALVVAGVPLARAHAIVQPRVGYFARPDAVGFLGNSVLDKLDPYLDYAGGELGV